MEIITQNRALDKDNQILRLETSDLEEVADIIKATYSGYFPYKTEQIYFGQEEEINIITLQEESSIKDIYIPLEFKSKLEIVEVKQTKYYTTILKINHEETNPIYIPVDSNFNVIILAGAIANAFSNN